VIVRSYIAKEETMPSYRDPRDGRWRYRTRVVLPNGKHKRISGSAPTATNTQKASDHAERLHILRETSPGLVQMPTTLVVSEPREVSTTKTVRQYAPEFLELYLPDSKPSERASKEQILDAHIVPAFGPLQLDEIRQSHVDGFTARELKRGMCRKTINNRLAVLSSLLKYAHENHLIAKPTLRLNLKRKGAAKDAPIHAVPADDVAKLIAAATDQRYRVAILLASEAGLRIGEILGLQWTDIRDGELRVRRAVDPRGNVGKPKHDKERDVPLSPALVAELARAPRRGLWVFGRLDGDMLSYASALKDLNKIYERAGVTVPVSDTGETRPWHSLRHAFGTECASRGMPITTLQELMGHEDVQTTRRYVTVTKEHKHDGIALVFGAPGQQVANTLAKSGSGSKSSTEN